VHAQNPLAPFLQKIHRRSLLTGEEKEAILGLPVRIEQVSAHTDFVRLGSSLDHSCLIVHGLAGRFGQGPDGNRQITALHLPGDMADLHSLLSPLATSAMQALTTTTIVRIPHVALREIVVRYPAIAECFWRECVIDAAVLSEWVINICRRNAGVRLAHLYCETAYRYRLGSMAEQFAFELPVTQHQLADMLGLTAVHVNRTMRALVARGLVHVTRGTVEIPSWRRLVDFADFDPAYLHFEVAPRVAMGVVMNGAGRVQL
jgi:CRP-like cAMP-binding protein